MQKFPEKRANVERRVSGNATKCHRRTGANIDERVKEERVLGRDILILVADHVGRFHTETYCGPEGTGNKERRRR